MCPGRLGVAAFYVDVKPNSFPDDFDVVASFRPRFPPLPTCCLSLMPCADVSFYFWNGASCSG